MRENRVEEALRKKVIAAGGLCLKFVSPGQRGVPDRLCIMPHGVVAFAELKAPGKHIDPDGLQAYWQGQLQRFGIVCAEISTIDTAGAFVEALTAEDAQRGQPSLWWPTKNS